MSKPSKEISLKKMRWMLFLLGCVKIPIIGFVKPRLVALDEERASVTIRLRRRSKNHLNSMYFGALAVGADVAAGLHAFYFAEKMGKKVSFAFKGMKAEFLMRAESDIEFISEDGAKVSDAMNRSLELGERINEPIMVVAKNTKNEVVATFEMIVSVKVKP